MKTLVKILTFLSLAKVMTFVSYSSFSRNSQSYFINKKDLISIDIDHFLPRNEYLNEFTIDESSNLDITIPSLYKKEKLEDEVPEGLLENMI